MYCVLYFHVLSGKMLIKVLEILMIFYVIIKAKEGVGQLVC